MLRSFNRHSLQTQHSPKSSSRFWRFAESIFAMCRKDSTRSFLYRNAVPTAANNYLQFSGLLRMALNHAGAVGEPKWVYYLLVKAVQTGKTVSKIIINKFKPFKCVTLWTFWCCYKTKEFLKTLKICKSFNTVLRIRSICNQIIYYNRFTR